MPGVISQLPSGKSINYGIEAVNQLVWTGWEPGREYVKNIVLKNVRIKTQKLKFKAPKSRFFTTMFPESVMLSAGNSFTLPITFQPLEKIAYDGCIEFVTNEGCFAITLIASLPQYGICVPQQVMFGMCAVNDSIRASLEVQNASELVTPIHVSVLEPFAIEQCECILQPFTSQKFSLSFQPKAATIYECTALVQYGLDFSSAVSTRLIGSGKYPRLSITRCGLEQSFSSQTLASFPCGKETIINFGTVAIGQTVGGWFEIVNQSQVNAPFKIDSPIMLPSNNQDPANGHVADQRIIDRVFHCKQKKGCLAASKSTAIQISFSPKICGRAYTEYFHVKAYGCPTYSVVKCIGSCSGPEVALSQGLMNFNLVMLGEKATKVLEIVNKSAIDAAFQFEIDCDESVFKLDTVCGVIPPCSHKTILVHFHPVHAMNYYRRVSCLVHNQDVLTLELLGTCHSDDNKPAVLQPIHLQRYQLYVEREMSFLSPECLNEMFSEGKLSVDAVGALYSGGQDAEYVSTEPLDVIPTMDEYFNDGYHSDTVLRSPHVSLDVNALDFGNVACTNYALQQTVSLTNHTQGKVSVLWTGKGGIFSISPSTVDIPPLKSVSFQVCFKPVTLHHLFSKGNMDSRNTILRTLYSRSDVLFEPVKASPQTKVDQMYSAELECYAQYASLRDFTLTEDKTHFPPWCVTLKASGQTFQPNSEAFLPRYSIDPVHMAQSVVNEHDASYRTVLLTNTGPTPISFIANKDTSGSFSLKPFQGMVPVGGHQVLMVKYSPASTGPVMQHTIRLRLNNCDKYIQDLMAYGSVELPEVQVESGGVVFFKPTCVGTVCSRSYYVQNISRLPVCFEWKLKHSDSEVIEVRPAVGVIQPNEIQYHEWFFKPQFEVKYMLKPILAAWSSAQPGYRQKDGRVKHFTLRAIGEGASGRICSKQTCIDAGSQVVGTVSYQHLTLVNDSVCCLYYKLCVEQSVSGPYTDDGRLSVCSLGIELSPSEGLLAARASSDILLTIRPNARVSYRWKISYSLHTAEGDCSDSSTESTHLCDVIATGVYPTVAVTDAHSYGSASGLSKKQIWNLFSLDNFNMFLYGDPSARELTFSAPTRHSHDRRPPVYTRAIVDFNFSAAPVGSEPCVVQLQLENNCPVSCDWAFLLPSDQQLELEYWAESGEFDSCELHEMKVMDNKIFGIEPSKGKLLPGETCCLTLTYKHTMIGTDRLPVLLKLTRGREILLNFVGVTVSVDRPYIHFPSARHMFSPVPIGESRSPTQIYELYNGGAVPVTYEIDLSPLRIICQENYGHSVFECLNPKGCIKPGQTAAVEWRFSPLEARTYMADIKIAIEHGEDAVVTFTGIGFDKRLMGTTLELTDITPQLVGVPSVQSSLLPGQACYLSQERISVGNLPLLASVRRIVVLTNSSTKRSVKYVWHVTNENHAQFLTVYPRSDLLKPGQSTICKVTFYAVGQPAFYDIDLVCETIFEDEYNEYLQKLSKWETERERLMVEFTVTEKDPHADLRLPSPEERPSSGRLKSLSTSTTVSDADLTKYKLELKLNPFLTHTQWDSERIADQTLPPIIKQSVSTDDLRASQKLQRRFNDCFWPKPCPPKPFMLHLGVTARTHDIAEFLQHFPDDRQRFFIDRSLSNPPTDSDSNNAGPSHETICCHQDEADMIGLVLQNVLRSLVDDAQFQNACDELSTENIPYFQQLTEIKVPSTNHDLITYDPSSTALPPIPNENVSTDYSQSSSETSMFPDASQTSTGSTTQFANTSLSQTNRLSSTQLMDDVVIQPPSIARSVPSFHENVSNGFNEVRITDSQDRLMQLAEVNFDEKMFALRQQIKTQPESGCFMETCIENTIMNIVEEAFRHEFNITARPRLVALPPRPSSATRQC